MQIYTECNAQLQIWLMEGEDLCAGKDYETLAYTKVEFGYLFDIENHGIESLFKVITDKDTCYFAVQGTNLLRLTLNEELYKGYVDSFYDIRKPEIIS